MLLKSILFLSIVCGLAKGSGLRFIKSKAMKGVSQIKEIIGLAGRSADHQTTKDGGFHFEEHNNASTSLWQRQVDRIISRGVLHLALELDHTLSPVSRPGEEVPPSAPNNVVFSPLSVAEALALVLLGAGGQTFQEVARVLGLATGVELAHKSNVVHEEFGRLLAILNRTSDSVATTQAITACAIFVQEDFPVRDRFRQVSREAYTSEVVNVDFVGHGEDARLAVNSWVESKTHGRIKDLLLQAPSPSTRLLIASALYFNGEWEHPFPFELTAQRPFYVSGYTKKPGEVISVTSMANIVDLPYHASSKFRCRILGLPYKGKEMIMYFVLPNKQGYKALKELEDELTISAIEELASSTTEEDVIALIPRMKLESSMSLKDALLSMGVHSLFNPMTANLSLISPGESSEESLTDNTSANTSFTTTEDSSTRTTRQDQDQMIFRDRREAQTPGLYADDVIHRVEIEVTETGTVASAATLVSMTRSGGRPTFRVDRPFLFFIQHKPTGFILGLSCATYSVFRRKEREIFNCFTEYTSSTQIYFWVTEHMEVMVLFVEQY